MGADRHKIRRKTGPTRLELLLKLEGDFRKRLGPIRVTPSQAGVILFLRRQADANVTDAVFPPGKPSDYRIAYGLPGQDVPVTPELKQFDTTARTWLSEARFPRDVGNSLVTAIAKTAQHTKDMTPDQLETYGTAEFAKLQKAHGAALEERLQAAGRMVEALDKKTPGLKNLLKSKGLGDNALIASMLIQQAERWHARREAQGTR